MTEVDGAPAPTGAMAALDPFAPGFAADPYRQYAALRDQDPVHRSALGAWFLTRYDDVHRVLRNPATSVEERNAPAELSRRARLREIDPERAERGTREILNIDPPDHTRIRRLVAKAFTPRTVERLRGRVAEIVDERLDDLAARGQPVDLIAGLAFPLPFQVISEMLGMPSSIDTLQLREWSHTVTQALDPVLAMTNADAIAEASDRVGEVVLAAIEAKRAAPGDDLLTALIEANHQGDVLSDAELIDNVVLLYLAGHETTVNLIGNGTLALLRHRGELERLAADPELAAGATDELLRYDSPVQFSRRIATEAFELDGHHIEVGDFVMTGLGAANRDPARWGPDADVVQIDRPEANQHVSFGSGVHHCLGAALARLEGTVALGTLARRFPSMELADDEPAWNGRIVLRGLDHLHVALA